VHSCIRAFEVPWRVMTFRVATFNLKDFFEARTERERERVEAKLNGVAESLRRARADVVALQEVGSEALLARLVSTVPELGYASCVVGSEDRRGIRNAILSRLPVTWSCVHEASSLSFPVFVVGDPEPFAGRIPLRRGVVHVRVAVPQLGDVDILTVHFKSNLPAPLRDGDGHVVPDPTPKGVGEAAVRSLVLRAAEALHVRSLVDAVWAEAPERSVCVLGDLNDTVESLAVRLVRGIDPTSAQHLRPAAEFLPEERRFSCMHRGGRSLIDHVLLSERLYAALRHTEIHNEALRDHGILEGEEGPTEDSDHALCVAELGVPF
jgi:endonuclease/exonuclease/phosphatase family metal-dependent hydrolase